MPLFCFSEMDLLQICIVKSLEKCQESTPANLVESMFKFVRKETPCVNMTSVSYWLAPKFFDCFLSEPFDESSIQIIFQKPFCSKCCFHFSVCIFRPCSRSKLVQKIQMMPLPVVQYHPY